MKALKIPKKIWTKINWPKRLEFNSLQIERKSFKDQIVCLNSSIVYSKIVAFFDTNCLNICTSGVSKKCIEFPMKKRKKEWKW